MMNKFEKKSLKMVKKGLYKLNDEYGHGELNEYILDSESKVLFIANAGTTTGMDEVLLFELFTSFGYIEIDHVISVPGKQYSFVVFNDSSHANSAMKAMSGIALSPEDSPIYMATINKTPNVPEINQCAMPPGLQLIEDFITEDEEDMLVNLIDFDDEPQSLSESIKQRDVRHFGFEFNYEMNAVDRSPCGRQIPLQFRPICQRMVDRGVIPELPDQLTVNKYTPGQGIAPHVDTHSSFTSEILSLSTSSGITMDFELQKSNHAPKSSECLRYSLYLPRRSLCIMSGPSRYLWSHGIRRRKTDLVRSPEGGERLCLKNRGVRISFTFRKVSAEACRCSYPEKCDSQMYGRRNGTESFPQAVNCKNVEELEKEHVQRVYDNIADHFSDTRHKPWPNVFEFIRNVPSGSRVVEIGCGNGKYLEPLPSNYLLGCDISVNLLSICSSRNIEVAAANALHLPFRDASFDAVLSIAVFHHLASEERRKKAIAEVIRILANGGVCLIYVWAMEQRKGKMSAYLKQRRRNKVKKGDNVDEQNQSKEKEFKLSEHEHQNTQNQGQMETNSSVDPENESNTLSTLEKLNVKDTKLEQQSVTDKSPFVLPVHENRTDFTDQDMFVPWKLKDKKGDVGEAQSPQTFYRYYHLYREGELEEMIKDFPQVTIINSYYDEGNWCVVFKKNKLNEK